MKYLFSDATSDYFSPIEDTKAIGFIKGQCGSEINYGTGFVYEHGKLIVTCAHVIKQGGIYSFYSREVRLNEPIIQSKVEVIAYINDYDLVLLKADTIICDIPLKGEINKELQPKQKFIYYGYDYEENLETAELRPTLSYVAAQGVAYEKNKPYEFIECDGFAKPGFSGGPVLNSSHKVIGVIGQTWLRRPFEKQEYFHLTRFFPIQPVIDKLNDLQIDVSRNL